MATKNEAYVHGRKAGVKTNENMIKRNGTHVHVPGGGEKCDSGSHQADLSSAAHSLYQKSVKNGGGHDEIGDKAVKSR